MTTKTHLVADGKGWALAFVLTGGQLADTTMLPDALDALDALDEIRMAGATGRRRQCSGRLLADQGYPSTANRAWLRERPRHDDPGT